VLNGFVFGLSIVVFNKLLLPFLQTTLSVLFFGSAATSSFWFWIHLLLKWTFDSLWVLPLFILSRIVNALWFQVSYEGATAAWTVGARWTLRSWSLARP
jgi:etoposide-induced 2.4 mRNA